MKSRLTILAAAAVLAAMSLASCQKVYLGDIEDRLGRLEETVDSLAGIDDQIAGIGTTIADLRTAVEALQSSSASTSSQVQSAIAALEARIAALEQLQESLATKEWAEGTFATLAAQQQTAAALAGVQAAVAAALAGMPEGKTVTEAIDAASQSVQDWVSEKLAGYCTIGTIEGKLSAMKAELEAQVAGLGAKADSLDDALNAKIAAANAEIAALNAALEAAKAEITTAYTNAINSAKAALEQDIADLDGRITVNTAAINAANSKIDTLEGTVATLQEALSSLIGRVDSMELELAGIDGQIAGIGTTIAGLRTAVEALQASSASSSAQAQTAIAALEARIAALEQLQESLATKEWAEGTFATLAAQQQTAADLAGVQAAVAAALAGMPEGKTVTEAIDAASQSVQDWVNEKLAGYCTIGTIEGKLNTMKTELAAQVAALGNKADSLDDALTAKIGAAEASIAALGAALDAAKTEITAAYEAAITAAINSAKGELNVMITANTDAINAANSNITTLDGKVTDLGTDVADLQSSLAEVVDRLEKLETMVQSVVFVPRYKGGSAVVKSLSEVNSFTLDYEVLPRKAGKAIADSWSGDKSILTVNYRQVATRAGLPTLEIKDVEFNETDSLLNVTVSLYNGAEIFRSKHKSLAVSLEINTGATMVSSPFTDIDNAIEETANCYIVKEAGEYRFNAAVRGNGWNPDGTVADAIDLTGASAKVLWESFGTDTPPTEGALIPAASLESDGYVKFTATGERGNAVIAVTDGDNKILWSWHIWLAGEQPQDQVYNNGAGTMMDRNLGATSAEKGNPGALGLLYQWGRKDPFLGGNGINSDTQAASTGFWETTDGPTTVDEAVKNPTKFYTASTSPYDWTSPQDNDLWKSSKTMYDPCPAGYRVPDGGDTGVWNKAGFTDTSFDSTYKGMSFSTLQDGGTTWYPAAGCRGGSDGTLGNVGPYGFYLSCTVDDTSAYGFGFYNHGSVYPSDGNYYRSFGQSVRCLRE